MEQWIRPKLKEWAETIETLGRFVVSYLQTSYSIVAMFLQAEWQYLMQTVLEVGEHLGLVEEALANTFLMKLLGLDSISGMLRKILALGAKRAELKIKNPTEVADERHRTSLACTEYLVESLSQERPSPHQNIGLVSGEAEGKGNILRRIGRRRI